MDLGSMLVSLLTVILAVASFSYGVCMQKSCPLGTFCPIEANCNSNTSLCVVECSPRTTQGNWSSGNCEHVPEDYDHWLDATFYEVLIPPNLSMGAQILNVTLSLTRMLQSDDEDEMSSGSGSGFELGCGFVINVTFHLETDYPYFKFNNRNATDIEFGSGDSLTETHTIVKMTSHPIPLGDYEMQIIVTRGDNVLQNTGLLVHVVEPFPSSLPAPVTCVEFELSEYTVLESVGILNVTLLLMGKTQPTSFNVIVIANDTGSSTAIAGADFTPGRYNATFLAGATKATTSIPILVDNVDEETEQFDLKLYIDATGYGLGLQNGNIKNATAFIVQPNTTGIIVEFKESIYSVIEDVSIYNVTIVKKGNSNQNITVRIIPSPETARFRFDYSLASAGIVTFTPGGPNEHTIQLSVDKDELLELNETYLLALHLSDESIDAGAQVGAINQTRVTIINDDKIQVFFRQKSAEIREFEKAIIPVGFSPPKTTIPFTIRVETFDLSARANIDYRQLVRNVTLSQFMASEIVQVEVIENNITDGNRQFGLRLIIPEEAQQLGIELGAPSELNVTILDDDVGDLEVACFTSSTGDVMNGHSIQLQCSANQIFAYSCRVNAQLFQPCLNPQTIRNVNTSGSVMITVNARAPNMPPVSLTLTALTTTAELQVLSAGRLAVHLHATKNATFRCRLNDRPFITCVDGQTFDDLNAGTYTLTVRARGVENMQDTSSYTIGPVVMIAGVNATETEAIAACFGSWAANCSNNDQNCEYTANWRTIGDQIEVTVTARTQGWLGIGFSVNNKMVHSDVVVGASNGSHSFVDDRYAVQRSLPQKDAVQNIYNISAAKIDGVTTIEFVRDKTTNDSNGDINLNTCRFVLFAWGDNVDINTGTIQYHGMAQRNASDTLICFPSAAFCPIKFDCGDPGMPINGARNFSSTLEDNIVTYSCEPGYELIGNKTRMCIVTAEEGAQWKYDIPKCQFLTIAFASNEFNGTEASGLINVEIALSQQLPSNGSIIIEVISTEQMPQSAEGSGVDFISNTLNVTFEPGEDSKSLRIPIICDNVIEETETFEIAFSVLFHSVPVNIGLNNATAIITDSTVEVTFSQSNYVISEETGLLFLGVKLSQPSLVPFEITVSLRNATSAGESFIERVFNETIDAGNTEQSFLPVALITNNNIVECTKVLGLILTTSEACKTTTSMAEVNVTSDDVGAVSLQMPDTVNESIGSFMINFSLNATASKDIVLTVNISYTAGADFNQTELTAPSSSLTISSGELFASVNIEVNDDTVKEENKTFLISVLIQNNCLPLVINGNNNFTITVIDDEELTVEFSKEQFSGSELSNGISVMLKLLGGTLSEPFNVTILLSSSTATGGTDYDDTPLTVTFNAGDANVTVVIPIMNDNIKEEDEELTLTISISPSVDVRLGTLVNATAVIIDSTLPQIITHPLNKTVEVNNDTTTIQLQCATNEATSYTWEKQDGAVPANAEGVDSNTLTLIGVTPDDNGQYRCVAINDNGRSYSNYATVTVEAHPPMVTVAPSSVAASEGDSVTLTCLATGVGASSFAYEWQLNGSLIRGLSIDSITINAVSESTIGNYTCIVKNQYGDSSQSNGATVTLKPPFCDSVIEMYVGFNITWEETQIGDTVVASCTGAGLAGRVRRRCIGEDVWEEFNECISEEINILMEEISNLTSSLNTLTAMDIIPEVDEIVTKLVDITSPDQIQTELPSEINAAVDIISSLNSVTKTVVDMLQPNDTYFEKTVQVLDNLLSKATVGSWQQLQKTSPSTSQRFITSIEQFEKHLGDTLSTELMKSTKAGDNIVIKAEIITRDFIDLEQPYMFPDNSDNINSFTGRDGHILIPNILLKDVLDMMPQGSTEFIITNSLLRDGSLPLPNSANGNTTKEPVSSIISCQLPIPIDKTNHLISLIFDVPSTTLDQTSNGDVSRQQHTCEFYDHTLSLRVNQTGGWSSAGIRLDQSRSNATTVTCLSTHLTSFAVLAGIQNETQSPSDDDDEDDDDLSIIAYIGCALSLACLILSIIALSVILCRNKGKENHVFIHLNLCIALALGLIAFIAGIENATDDRTSCVVVAVLLQYFFTSAFCWVLCEGVMLYMMLITVLDNKLNRQWFYFILGWGPAIPIVAISVGITHEQYGTDEHCWIDTGDGALAAFIIPIVMMIVVTCVFMMIALRVLYGNQRRSIDKKKPTRNAIRSLLKATVIFLPLLTVTWIFGLLAVNEEPVVYVWIFAVLAVVLGLLIFLFHVARDDRVGLNKKMKKFYRSETFHTFYSGIRYYTVSRISNNGKNRFSNGDTNSHNGVKMSASTDNMEDHSTTTTTFKPPPTPEIPLEDRDVKKDPAVLMATNPLEETVLSEDINQTGVERGTADEETTMTNPTNEN